MRKSQSVKVKGVGRIAGSTSCVSLLLLAFLLVNPLVGSSASALEGGEGGEDSGGVAAQSDDGVVISFSPASGAASLTPTTADGTSAKINISANIKIASTGGYTIYLGGKNAALTGERTGETIAATSSPVTFDALKTNTWGYAVAEGSAISDTATYSALPQGQGTSLESKSGNQKDITKTYTMSFAVRIGNDKPADVYSNQVMLSVTSNPYEVVSLAEATEMQQMNSTVCDSAKIGDTKQLKDTRDGKYYWVAKLADGKCWMTQNLDLDITEGVWPDINKTDVGYDETTGRYVTPANWDAVSSYKPLGTAKVASLGTVSSKRDTTGSWDFGSYVPMNPERSLDCGTGKSSLSDCASMFFDVSRMKRSDNPTFYYDNYQKTATGGEYDAHYLVGNYYSWNTATAGTGEAADDHALASICPKNWQLPSVDIYQTLIGAAGFAGDVTKPTGNGFFFVRGGFVGDSSVLLGFAGDHGRYWTSTPSDSDLDDIPAIELAKNFTFSGSNTVGSNFLVYKFVGDSVRCVAR